MVCRPFNINGVVGIACGPKPRVKNCSSPGCPDKGPLLCDHPMGNGRTCDKPICHEHAQSIGRNLDLCPEHAR